MSWNPVKNDAEPGGVRSINEIAEVFAGAEAAGWRIQSSRLIAPATIEGVFVNRQQLQMGKAHPFGVRNQFISEFAIAQPEIVVGVATP